ncbi:MAG: hypothetical protein ABIZ64_03840 [Casimicrobium sp.]
MRTYLVRNAEEGYFFFLLAGLVAALAADLAAVLAGDLRGFRYTDFVAVFGASAVGAAGL